MRLLKSFAPGCNSSALTAGLRSTKRWKRFSLSSGDHGSRSDFVTLGIHLVAGLGSQRAGVRASAFSQNLNLSGFAQAAFPLAPKPPTTAQKSRCARARKYPSDMLRDGRGRLVAQFPFRRQCGRFGGEHAVIANLHRDLLAVGQIQLRVFLLAIRLRRICPEANFSSSRSMMPRKNVCCKTPRYG